MDFTGNQRLDTLVVMLLMLATAAGDLAPTFGQCCAYGAGWARESQLCSIIPPPINAAIPPEHQSICITTAAICCLRYFRDEQCQKGKQAAQVGQDCVSSSSQGGEYFKDCCQGCKLGLFSASMGMGCNTRFKFGFPWHDAFMNCCSTSPNLPGNQVVDGGNLYPGQQGSASDTPESEDLCAKLPGKLCSDICVPTPGSYRCMCRHGFTLSIDGKTCVQDSVTDRCQVNNPCDHNCIDTGASIVCSCNAGFILKADLKSCEDINECSSGEHACVAVEQVCYNLVPSYVCINADGSFSAPGPTPLQGGSPGSLPAAPRPSSFEISNEVAQGRTPFIGGSGILGVQGFPGTSSDLGASSLSQSQGRCPPGYSFNLETQACDDVDECEVTSGLCGQGAICQNTIGSYSCTHMPVVDCPPGFAFDLNLQSCLDIDECVDNTHNCNWTTHSCVNTQGGYMCEEKSGSSDCAAGYKFSIQQQKCIDVDECAEELHGCHPEDETCRNTVGAYECDMACDEGFQFSLVLRTCVDQDECVDAPCEPGWECRNTVGSYLCHELPRAFCPAGYKPSNGTASGCEDVDECVEGLHSCHAVKELCINEIGKYRCEAVILNEVNAETNHFRSVSHGNFQPQVQECPEGFGYDLTTRQCLDIDECNVGLDDCSQAEKCINTLGSYVCQPRVRCSAGFAADLVTGECKDVDECAAGVANCLPGQICHNTEGAFDCRVECQDGFRYDPTDAAVCVDVNECLLSPCNFGEDCRNTEGSYICTTSNSTISVFTTSSTSTASTTETPVTCPSGFRRNSDTLQCEDLNECLDSVCEVDQRCTNTYGSYTCLQLPCNQGYQRNPHTSRCEDVDECESSPCKAEEQCVNSNGSFSCRRLTPCSPGFRKNEENNQCEDIDECVEEAPCGPEERCVNIRGSYRCRSRHCLPGYQRNIWGQCRDVNECETGEHTCNIPKEECVNSLGTYRCKPLPDCPEGFTRNPTSFRCVDVDECIEGTHDCVDGERCFNQYGQYACRGSPSSCSGGFRYNSLDRRCKDINECEENSDNCDRDTQTCINSKGGFRCIDREPSCDFGFRYSEDQQNCVDIDECATDPCKTLEVCENTQGSYQCQCQLGYYREETDGDCQDMNECQLDLHTCASTQRCDNTIGSYACTRIAGCGTGYTLNHNTDQCDDIDECTEDNPCRQNERCINMLGSYRCQPYLICNAGYEMNEAGTQCIDVDECVKGTHQCEGKQRCSNRQGGYVCHCPEGFRLNAQRQCQDINECEYYHGRVCANNAECENTEGSYICKCKEGFKQASNGISCIDVDECEEVPGICSHNCFNVWGTYQCTCRAGHILASDNRTCTDVDECENFRGRGHLCIGLCVNIPGSFKCTCPDGYTLAADGRTCKDTNECEAGNLCRGIDEQCVNTRGGYKCNTITCPDNYVRDTRHKNAPVGEGTVVCRKRCAAGDHACITNNTHTVLYSSYALPTISYLPDPMPLTTIRFISGRTGQTVRTNYRILTGNSRECFDVQRIDRFGWLRLVQPVVGPDTFLLLLQMEAVGPSRRVITRHLAYIDIDVSVYTF